MHPIDAHQKAGHVANQKFRERYGHDDFEYETPEHSFWLECFNRAFAKYLLADH